MKTTLLFVFLMACSVLGWSQNTKSVTVPSSPEAVAEKQITFKGDYRSLRGVMNPLSCHCFDGGILTTSSGKEIKVCFEKGELEAAQEKSDKLTCRRIQVTGTMVPHYLEPSKGGVCSGGTVTYLKVKSFKCLN
ncbi:MAG TPA: hypothetical protein VHS96_17910 [Bacteroidia bacterium]|nr:hypothetical protein [Bacteroidia bacterium]